MKNILPRRLESSDQRGAVAMLSVTVFAIIITVVATSYIKTVISQQRNALNYDQGTRAYFAAESGVQDGARAIQTNPTIRSNGKTDCAPVGPLVNGEAVLKSPDYGIGYTCQIIDVTPTALEGTAMPNEKSTIVKIEPKEPGFNRDFQITFRWSKQYDTNDMSNFNDEILYPRSDDRAIFPASDKWNAVNFLNNPIHALLRTQFITHPKGGPSFNREQVEQRVMFLNPTDVGAAGNSPSLQPSDSVNTQQSNLFSTSACINSDQASSPSRPDINFDGYSCVRTLQFNGYRLQNSALYINIGAVYRPTNFSITMLESQPIGSGQVPLANAQATIDVTGKSGDTTFRRVRQSLPLGGYVEKNGPDAALVVGEGICKQFTIGTAQSLFGSACTP